MAPPLLLDIDKQGVATLTFNRPDRHNAFDDLIIHDFLKHLAVIEKDAAIRVLVIKALGASFCAGADLNWMQRMADFSREENEADARALATLLTQLHGLHCPTLAVVQGPAYGGGVGIVAACDIAIAASTATFCLTETRLGLTPAVISPYVINTIGARAASRYFLTSEIIHAAKAEQLGLIHEAVLSEELEAKASHLVRKLLQGGPQAITATKQLIAKVAPLKIEAPLVEHTVKLIAATRASSEAREGMQAFLTKRKPSWIKSDV